MKSKKKLKKKIKKLKQRNEILLRLQAVATAASKLASPDTFESRMQDIFTARYPSSDAQRFMDNTLDYRGPCGA
jgi:hypothetical protein